MTSSLQSGARRRHRQAGAALIIVLALLVLITALVAIFLSRALIERKVSASSASGNSASILARSAVDMITGDLRQEIVNGSTATVVGPSTNETTLYFPISPTNMVPLRAGIATNSAGVDQAPNLVRRSVRSDTLAVPSRASAINSSTDASYNGRTIALARWNSHYLIPRANAGSTTIDSTPATAFTAPDWVMITSSGPKVLTTPDQTTIGRYAYAIYDEGGLLDANVAGYPSGMTNYLPSQLAGKGSLALADLTAIGLTTTDVDNLVGWRNYATAQPASGSFGSYNFNGDANASTNYYSYVSTTTNGFLVVNPQQFNNRTDQAFSSRQALLKYQRAANFSQDALQYLGTFSRDLEQPSFYPDSGRPRNTRSPDADASSNNRNGGGNDAVDPTTFTQNQDLINPSLLTARDVAGQPVMKRRFPLSRLSLLEQAGATLRAGGTPSSSVASQIYIYFGLTWDATNSRWIYWHEDALTSHSATTPSQKILKLSDIAALNVPTREPDFFETLKAVINCDSLGKQNAGWDGNTSPHNVGGIDCSINYQVIQIGANLADQYDADSYPTHIAFDAPPSPGATHDFYGTENLPYLAGWTSSWFRARQLASGDIMANTSTGTFQPPTVSPGKNGFPFETWVFLHPIIWNPHAPDSRSSPPNVPTNFRVVAGGGGKGALALTVHPVVFPPWWTTVTGGVPALTGGQHSYPATGGFTTSTFSDATIDPTLDFITFSTGASPADFREPYCLRTQNFPSGSTADISYAAGKPSTSSWVDTTLLNVDAGSQMIGFFCGKAWTGPSCATAPSTDLRTGDVTNCLAQGSITSITSGITDMQFLLQYQMGNSWYTYDMINDVYVSAGNSSSVDVDDTNSAVSRGFRACFRVDARTDRWGLPELNIFPIGSIPSSFTTANSDGLSTPTPNVPWPQGTTINPSSSYAYRMTTSSSGISAPGWKWTLGSSNFPLLNLDVSDLAVNVFNNTVNPNVSGTPTTTASPGGKFYYTDPDGVIRRAEGAYFSGNDGLPLYTGNTNSRPVILNRPFESVAEMGYAFSGIPWRSVDFFTPESGYSALLDAFCLNDLQNAPSDVTVEGRVNLNTRQPKVLQALIQGVSKAEGGVMSPTGTEAPAAAQALVTWTTADPTLAGNKTSGVFNKGPLRNLAELVGKYVAQVNPAPASVYTGITDLQSPTLDGSQTYSGFSSVLKSGAGGVFTSSTDAAIKRRRECVMRALADAGNTRTWNLLIDVIAQTGRYPATATSAADLPKFIVNGESRYWVHVAIDRYTGAIVAESFEPVEE